MNKEHYENLLLGVSKWNEWRKSQLWFSPINLSGSHFHNDLSGIDLRDADLSGADFSGVSLNKADLRDANLTKSDFTEAQLIGCDLRGANLDSANFRKANLERANLGPPDLLDIFLDRADKFPRKRHTEKTSLRKASFVGANLDSVIAENINAEMANFAGAHLRKINLKKAILKGANLNGANCFGGDLTCAVLDYATLIETNLENACIAECSVYGVSAWDTQLKGTIQSNLRITPNNHNSIVTDNLEIAQFMYLVINNKKVRDIIDSLSTKLVLILGRFTEERKAVLDDLRNYIRSIGLIPVLFDFEKPRNRNMTETVVTLAHLSRIVIADVTNARAVPQELQAVVPRLSSVNCQPICCSSDDVYGMFEDFKDYSWVLPMIRYDSPDDLKASLRPVLTGQLKK